LRRHAHGWNEQGASGAFLFGIRPDHPEAEKKTAGRLSGEEATFPESHTGRTSWTQEMRRT
jgi:hypothetical protein